MIVELVHSERHAHAVVAVLPIVRLLRPDSVFSLAIDLIKERLGTFVSLRLLVARLLLW